MKIRRKRIVKFKERMKMEIRIAIKNPNNPDKRRRWGNNVLEDKLFERKLMKWNVRKLEIRNRNSNKEVGLQTCNFKNKKPCYYLLHTMTNYSIRRKIQSGKFRPTDIASGFKLDKKSVIRVLV
jgi:hypothetical protein